MLSESLEYLAIRPDGTYVDATAGLGGHTGAIARQLTTGRLIACDRDAESLERAKQNTAEWAERIHYQHAKFSELRTALNSLGIERVDGLLADLGVSRYQLTDAERGFSLAASGPLDMRMDRSHGMTAAELVNSISERELADVIYQLGEERRARQISRAIVRSRPIHDTAHCAGCGAGRVADGTPASGHTDVYGAAPGREPRARRTRIAAGGIAGVDCERWARGDDHLHVFGRPAGEGRFSEIGSTRVGPFAEQACADAQRRGSAEQSSLAERQTAGLGIQVSATARPERFRRISLAV